MSEDKSPQNNNSSNTAIWIAIIGGVVTIIVAVITSILNPEIINTFRSPTSTPTATLSPPTATSTGIPTMTATLTSIPTLVSTPPPECLIEDFEGDRKGTWWSPDPDVFEYRESSEQALGGNQSLKVIYDKTAEFQFIGVELPNSLCKFQDAQKLHVWVYGEVTLLLKLEDYDLKQADVSEQSSTTPGEWMLLTFNYAGVADKVDLQNIKGFFLFPAPGNKSATGIFFIDDISLYP